MSGRLLSSDWFLSRFSLWPRFVEASAIDCVNADIDGMNVRARPWRASLRENETIRLPHHPDRPRTFARFLRDHLTV